MKERRWGIRTYLWQYHFIDSNLGSVITTSASQGQKNGKYRDISEYSNFVADDWIVHIFLPTNTNIEWPIPENTRWLWELPHSWKGLIHQGLHGTTNQPMFGFYWINKFVKVAEYELYLPKGVSIFFLVLLSLQQKNCHDSRGIRSYKCEVNLNRLLALHIIQLIKSYNMHSYKPRCDT